MKKRKHLTWKKYLEGKKLRFHKLYTKTRFTRCPALAFCQTGEKSRSQLSDLKKTAIVDHEYSG